MFCFDIEKKFFKNLRNGRGIYSLCRVETERKNVCLLKKNIFLTRPFKKAISRLNQTDEYDSKILTFVSALFLFITVIRRPVESVCLHRI